MTVLALLAVLATTAYMSHPPTETHGPIVQAGVVNRVTGSLPNERIKPMTGTQRRRLRWEQKQKQKQQQQTQSQSQVVDARLSVSNTQENKVEAVPDHSKQDDMCTNTMEATSSTTRNAANAAPAKRVDHDGEHEQVARGHGRAASEQAQAVEQQERPAESDVASDEEYKSVEHVNHVCAKSFVQDCENASEVVKSVTRADGGQQCGTKTMSTVGFQEPMSEYVRACDEFGIDLKASKAESVKMVTVAVQQEEIVPQSGHGNKIPVRAEAPTVDKPQLAAPPKSAARTRGLRSIVGKAIKTMFGRDKSKQDKVGADHGQDEISEPTEQQKTKSPLVEKQEMQDERSAGAAYPRSDSGHEEGTGVEHPAAPAAPAAQEASRDGHNHGQAHALQTMPSHDAAGPEVVQRSGGSKGTKAAAYPAPNQSRPKASVRSLCLADTPDIVRDTFAKIRKIGSVRAMYHPVSASGANAEARAWADKFDSVTGSRLGSSTRTMAAFDRLRRAVKPKSGTSTGQGKLEQVGHLLDGLALWLERSFGGIPLVAPHHIAAVGWRMLAARQLDEPSMDPMDMLAALEEQVKGEESEEGAGDCIERWCIARSILTELRSLYMPQTGIDFALASAAVALLCFPNQPRASPRNLPEELDKDVHHQVTGGGLAIFRDILTAFYMPELAR